MASVKFSYVCHDVFSNMQYQMQMLRLEEGCVPKFIQHQLEMVVVRLSFHKTIDQSRLWANKASHFSSARWFQFLSPSPKLFVFATVCHQLQFYVTCIQSVISYPIFKVHFKVTLTSALRSSSSSILLSFRNRNSRAVHICSVSATCLAHLVVPLIAPKSVRTVVFWDSTSPHSQKPKGTFNPLTEFPKFWQIRIVQPFKRLGKSHLPFAGIIRSSPYSPR